MSQTTPIVNEIEDSENFGRLDDIQVTYKWTLGVSHLMTKKTGEVVKSPVIFLSDAKHCTIRLYPKGNTVEVNDCLSVYLQSVKGDFTARVKFSILNNRGQAVASYITSRYLFEANKAARGCHKLKDNTCLSDEGMLTSSDSDGANITLLCEIIMDTSIERGPLFKLNDDPLQRALYDFEKLLNNEKFSDVIFTVEKETIHAHKNILAVKSPVFAAMFDHNTQDGEQARVVIEDIAHDVMRELLRFIYAGRVSNLEVIARELFVAADKYAVKELKDICERQLIQNIHTESVLDYLNLSSLHSAPTLKHQCMEFFKSNVKRIVRLSDFKMSQFDKNVVDDVFSVIADSWKTEDQPRSCE